MVVTKKIFGLYSVPLHIVVMHVSLGKLYTPSVVNALHLKPGDCAADATEQKPVEFLAR